jgi:hypothetical protein
VGDEFGDIAGDLVGLLPFGRIFSPPVADAVSIGAGAVVDWLV